MRATLVLAFCFSAFAIAVHGLVKGKDLDLISTARAIIEKQGVVPRESNMNTEDEKKVLELVKELFTTKDDLWDITYDCKEKVERLFDEQYACAIYVRDPSHIWYNKNKFVMVDLGPLRVDIFKTGIKVGNLGRVILRRQDRKAI